MFEMQDHVPAAFSATVQTVTVHLRQNAHEPTRVTVQFGERAMEQIPVDLLRRLFGITRLWDVPLEFLEEPSPVEGLIEITAEAEQGYSRLMLSPEVLVASH